MNANAVDATNRSVLDIDVLDLIEGTVVRADRIHGIEVVTWGPNTENRQSTIHVNGVASPRFHGSSSPHADRIWAVMSHGNTPNIGGRTERNTLTYMNVYGSTTNILNNLVPVSPFVAEENPSSFAVRITPNDTHSSLVTSVALLDRMGEVLGTAVYTSQDGDGSWEAFESFVRCGRCDDCTIDLREIEYANIHALNEWAHFPVEILQSEDDGVVYSIDGKFSSVLVTDAQSALKALGDVRALLGLTDPAIELEFRDVFTDGTLGYRTFSFNQSYKGVPVWGRVVTVVAHESGETLSLDSGFQPISSAKTVPTVSSESVMTEFAMDGIELIIYSFGEFESNFVLAYLGTAYDKTFVVSAVDGMLIEQWDILSESHGASATSDGGFSETLSCVDGNMVFTKNHALLSNWETELGNSLGIVFADGGDNSLVRSDYTQQTHGRDVSHHNQWHRVDGMNLEIYARTTSLYVNRGGANAFLHSNLLSAGVLENAFDGVSASAILSATAVAGNIESVLPNAELKAVIENPAVAVNDVDPVIYSWNLNWEDCECDVVTSSLVSETADPTLEIVYVFIDLSRSSTYYVCAITSTVLNRCNGCGYGHPLGKGLDEGQFVLVDGLYRASPRQLRYFPVTFVSEDNVFALSTPRTGCDTECPCWCDAACPGGCTVECLSKIIIQDRNSSTFLSQSTFFYEPEAVSAFLTIIETCKWYAENIERHDYITPGHGVLDHDRRIAHHRYATGIPTGARIDDLVVRVGVLGTVAFAATTYIGIPEHSSSAFSHAADLDIMGHEFQHGVFRVRGHSRSGRGMSTGIDEGYANLFGHFIDHTDADWLLYERSSGQNAVSSRWSGSRTPWFEVDFTSTMRSTRIEHEYMPFVVYPAWLMYDNGNGVQLDQLYQLYYASLTMGTFSATSNVNSVRVNVIKAARLLWHRTDVSFDNDDMHRVVAALESLEAFDARRDRVATLTVTVQDFQDHEAELPNLRIELQCRNDATRSPYLLTNRTPLEVVPGNYNLTITADSFVIYRNVLGMGNHNETWFTQLVRERDEIGDTSGKLSISLRDRINTAHISSNAVDLHRYNENHVREFFAQVSSDAVASLPAGYYYPIPVDGRNFFTQNRSLIRVVPGITRTDVPHHALDLYGKADVLVFDVETHIESNREEVRNFSSLRAIAPEESLISSVGDSIAAYAYGTRSSNGFLSYFFHLSGRIQTDTFAMGVPISEQQATILRGLDSNENIRFVITVRRFGETETLPNGVIAFEASDVVSRLGEDDSGFMEFMKFTYSSISGNYTLTPDFPAERP
jgi:hypothetical protein